MTDGVSLAVFLAVIGGLSSGFVLMLGWVHLAARGARTQADLALTALAAFKTEVAQNYASAAWLREVEGRLVTAIERLTSVINHLDSKIDKLTVSLAVLRQRED